ncbi:MAG: metallophosphoesterase [Hyphomicrobiaceae bacterium]|nr:metallophosphoesterase [Hyphomicrobiaceae bacterium]
MPQGTPYRLIQVSDTHLSRKRAYFLDNWRVLRDELAAAPPDLVVATGDLSFDGAADGDDLAFARAEHDLLPAPWIAVPGNHDIGESPLAVRLDQPIDDVRIARWQQLVGPQWWYRDIGAWRIVGIDTALLGSDRSEARAQWAFLETALASRDGRPVLLFQHMPPFLTTPEDMAFTTLAVPHTVRGRLLDVCVGGGVSKIACGHVHIHRRMEHKGIEIVWAPATSFFNIVEQQKAGRGIPRPGYLEWTLAGRDLSWRLVEPPLMITHDVGLWNAAYGSTTKMPPRPAR